MSAKASPAAQDLPPIAWRNPFLDGVDVVELPASVGWAEWDRAVAEIDARDADRPEFASRRAALHYLR